MEEYSRTAGGGRVGGGGGWAQEGTEKGTAGVQEGGRWAGGGWAQEGTEGGDRRGAGGRGWAGTGGDRGKVRGVRGVRGVQEGPGSAGRGWAGAGVAGRRGRRTSRWVGGRGRLRPAPPAVARSAPPPRGSAASAALHSPTGL